MSFVNYYILWLFKKPYSVMIICILFVSVENISVSIDVSFFISTKSLTLLFERSSMHTKTTTKTIDSILLSITFSWGLEARGAQHPCSDGPAFSAFPDVATPLRSPVLFITVCYLVNYLTLSSRISAYLSEMRV